MATTIYLFRHGQTALNAAGVLRGRIDEPLDSVGREQASRLRSLFSGVGLTRIVSSPLKRSFETARALAQPHRLTVAVDEALADRDYGPWAGRPAEDVTARYGSVDGAPAGEVEPKAAFEHRVAAALKRIAGHDEGAIVAVVAHDAVNRALIRGFGDGRWATADVPQPTGCWNRAVFEGGSGRFDIVGAVPGDSTEP